MPLKGIEDEDDYTFKGCRINTSTGTGTDAVKLPKINSQTFPVKIVAGLQVQDELMVVDDPMRDLLLIREEVGVDQHDHR